MTAYSLLGNETIKQNPSRKSWYYSIFGASVILLSSGAAIFYYIKHNKNGRLESDNQLESPPVRSINFSIPYQETPYYLNLDKYPIEDQILQVFPNTQEAIQKVTIQKLQQSHTSDSPTSWATNWLPTSTADNIDFSCEQQALPYPILRHMAEQYFPVKNGDSFYDNDNIPLLSDNRPFVLLPFDGQQPPPLDRDICIRVIVPFQDIGRDDIEHRSLYRPYPRNNADLRSPWWDTFLTHLTDPTTNATVPITLEPWRGHNTLRQQSRHLRNVNPDIPEWTRLREDEIYERPRTHIYEANVRWMEGWQLSCLLEFVEGRYNFEYGPIVPYRPIKLPIFPSLTISANTNTSNGTNREVNLLDQLKHHLSLPLCQGFDHPGRWLPFPNFDPPEARELLDQLRSQLAGLTRDNTYWAPYDCHYRHISYEQFNRCASRTYPGGLNLFGDSNLRRSTKKFLSHGNWCHDWHKHLTGPLLPDDQRPIIDDQTNLSKRQDDSNQYPTPQAYRFTVDGQTRSCYCEDFSEPYWNPAWLDPMARRFDFVYENNEEQRHQLGVTEWDNTNNGTIANNTGNDTWHVSSYKWDGLTYLNIPGWQGAVPDSPAEADVVIFSLDNWDAAFSELEPFLRDLDYLVTQIKEHYHGARIIYRTGQYYCCRIDVSGRTRQWSGPRMDVFEQFTRQKFIELGAEIWNTYRLGEAKSWEEKTVAITCPSNHVPADQVEIENQLLMNGLCNSEKSQ
ncbi:MAG: hypothetical protein EXX96DRAFT_591955 [Benjaminiella poitrasii]|nr:MAG: hypothetical protein EXX96DRAFT_591955 [Benjaminiella poitrasii]